MITARYTNFENNHHYRPKRRNDISCRRFTVDEKKHWTTDESDVETRLDKDRFIELAQAALEEAKMEEEQKGVLQELVEALIARTGAPMMADVILEQFRSQDVIERLAEDHFDEQRRRSSSQLLAEKNKENDALMYSPHALKEPVSIATTSEQPVLHQNSSNDFNSIDTILLISEYLWRLFRLLLLSSLVCLVYHFMCRHDTTNQPLFKL